MLIFFQMQLLLMTMSFPFKQREFSGTNVIHCKPRKEELGLCMDGIQEHTTPYSKRKKLETKPHLIVSVCV